MTDTVNVEELKGKISFLGFMNGLASWARTAWKLNPQFADYYQTTRLAEAAWRLDSYDSDEAVREDYRTGRNSIFMFNGTNFDEKPVFVNSREELKKVLLDEIRSFTPDPDIVGVPANDDFFLKLGKSWKMRSKGLPTCWQEFGDFCVNPTYKKGTLSLDKD